MIKYKMNPQPRLPILSLFRYEDEYGPEKVGWCYQSPTGTAGLTYNRPFLFGGNEPPNIGEVFRGGIVQEVCAVPEDDGIYWEVEIATPPTERGEKGEPNERHLQVLR